MKAKQLPKVHKGWPLEPPSAEEEEKWETSRCTLPAVAHAQTMFFDIHSQVGDVRLVAWGSFFRFFGQIAENIEFRMP